MTVYQTKYHMKFPKTQKMFDETDLTFSINHIRSRRPSIIYFILHCFNMDDDEIYFNGEVQSDGNAVAYTSPRSVITSDTNYTHYEQSFTLNEDLVEETAYTQIELITLGVDSENPLYFNEVMLQEGSFSEYHSPNEKPSTVLINFPNNNYVNLYNEEEGYLQVIRPNKESIHTTVLDKGQITILAPHIEGECIEDDPVNVFLEAMNQTEQNINVLR